MIILSNYYLTVNKPDDVILIKFFVKLKTLQEDLC